MQVVSLDYKNTFADLYAVKQVLKTMIKKQLNQSILNCICKGNKTLWVYINWNNRLKLKYLVSTAYLKVISETTLKIQEAKVSTENR